PGAGIRPASHVYSAGIVSFEVPTRTVPFSGDPPLGHALSSREHEVPKPSCRIAGVPPLIDAIVATATSSDIEERFADAREFLAALDDVAEDLNLPTYLVPVPHNSAAARTAAAPTNMQGIDATTHYETTVIIVTNEYVNKV